MRASITYLLASFLFLSARLCPAQKCPELEKEPSNERALAVFLKAQESARRKPDCTIFALRRLGSLNYDGRSMDGGLGASAVAELLAEYLDFQRPPLDDLEPLGVRGNTQLYPAVQALVAIGISANPALLKVIMSEKSSDIARENAVTAIMDMHRDDQAAAVRMLKTAAKKEKTEGSSKRLRQAMNDAAGRCGERDRSACQKIAAEK